MLGGFATVALLAGLGVLNGAAAAASLPATSALLPQTVPSGLLRQANGLARLGMLSAQMIGASLGGVLVAAFGSGCGLAIDAASFLVVAILFSKLRIANVQTSGTKSRPLADLRDGWRAFTEHRWVWIITLDALVVNAMDAGGRGVLGPVIADRTFGRAGWGLVLAANLFGSLLGAVLAARWQPRRALCYGTALLGMEAIPLLGLAHFPELEVLLPIFFVTGIALDQFGVAWDVSIQENIPTDKLARVYSYDAVGSFIAIPLGQLIAGPLATHTGISQTLNWAAGLIVLATLCAIATPGVRTLTVRE